MTAGDFTAGDHTAGDHTAGDDRRATNGGRRTAGDERRATNDGFRDPTPDLSLPTHANLGYRAAATLPAASAGQHRELHGLWNILTQGKTGYRNHLETVRWRGRLAALYGRHEELVVEMERRGYVHRSPLDQRLARGRRVQDQYVDSPAEQRRILREKGCGCATS